ncbi:MAG: acyl carrier protein [Acidobacteria bacterium]|nr:acyl carrier protein [Acidobacteriota bacterium]
MDEPLFAAIRRIAADVFGVPVDQITPASSHDSIENWDSIHHLNLVLSLEHAFSVQFEPEQIQQMLSIDLVVRQVREAMARRDAGTSR